jgi:hypothetical protein
MTQHLTTAQQTGKFVWKDSGNLSYGVFLGLLVTYHLAEFASVAT